MDGVVASTNTLQITFQPKTFQSGIVTTTDNRLNINVPWRCIIEHVSNTGVQHGRVDGSDCAGDAQRSAERVYGRGRHSAAAQRRQSVQPWVIPVYTSVT